VLTDLVCVEFQCVEQMGRLSLIVGRCRFVFALAGLVCRE
jgi:hypothetical protein